MNISFDKIIQYLDYLIDLTQNIKSKNDLFDDDYKQLQLEYEKFQGIIKNSFGIPNSFKEQVLAYNFDLKEHKKAYFFKIFHFFFIRRNLDWDVNYNYLNKKEKSNFDGFIQRMYTLKHEAIKLNT